MFIIHRLVHLSGFFALVVLLLMLPVHGAGGLAWGQNLGDPIDTAEVEIVPPKNIVELDVISLGIEIAPSPGEGSFFEEYSKLGGTTTTLDAYASPTLNLRLASFGSFRITVSGLYAQAEFIDIYGVRDTTRGRNGTVASIVDEFSVSAIPVLVGLEFAPVRTQFTTYVGGSIGASFNNVEWETTIREPMAEFYRPNINMKESGFFPAFKIYAGVDYRFDRNFWSDTPVRGIFLEGSYLVLPVRRNYFESIRKQGRGLPSKPDNDAATLNLGGVTFTIGVNLQFLRK